MRRVPHTMRRVPRTNPNKTPRKVPPLYLGAYAPIVTPGEQLTSGLCAIGDLPVRSALTHIGVCPRRHFSRAPAPMATILLWSVPRVTDSPQELIGRSSFPGIAQSHRPEVPQIRSITQFALSRNNCSYSLLQPCQHGRRRRYSCEVSTSSKLHPHRPLCCIQGATAYTILLVSMPGSGMLLRGMHQPGVWSRG